MTSHSENTYAVLMLVMMVVLFAYILVNIIYAWGLVQLNPPSRGESQFLFWAGLAGLVLILAAGIYTIIRIFRGHGHHEMYHMDINHDNIYETVDTQQHTFSPAAVSFRGSKMLGG